MIEMDSPSYKRTPSPALRQLLAADGFLAPLLQERTTNGIEIEVQFRSGDEVHLYCGLTCIVKCGRDGDSSIWVESHRTYALRPCANRLFRPASRRVDQAGHSMSATFGRSAILPSRRLWRLFLNGVTVGERQTKEGSIQAELVEGE